MLHITSDFSSSPMLSWMPWNTEFTVKLWWRSQTRGWNVDKQLPCVLVVKCVHQLAETFHSTYMTLCANRDDHLPPPLTYFLSCYCCTCQRWFQLELEKCAVVSTCRRTPGECKFWLHLLLLDKNTELVEKYAVVSTCILALLCVRSHHHRNG